MSASSVISAMLARSPRPSAISRAAASIRACRVRALRRSSRLAPGTPPAAATFTIVVLPSPLDDRVTVGGRPPCAEAGRGSRSSLPGIISQY